MEQLTKDLKDLLKESPRILLWLTYLTYKKLKKLI